jgi:hypothetical protein
MAAWMRRRPVLAMMSMLLVCCGGAVLLIGTMFWFVVEGKSYTEKLLNFHPTKFNSVAWKSVNLDAIYQDHSLYTRFDMIDDLLAHHDFHGWSEVQVESLLGPPDGNANQFVPPRMYYPLGYTTDTVWLIFYLDQYGYVIRYVQQVD